MGCKGTAQSINPNLWGMVPDSNQPTEQQEGECSEGYLARASNQSGEQSGIAPQETDPQAPAKIATVSVVAKCDMSISQQMKSTKPVPGQTWKFLDSSNAPISISGIAFSTTDGKITGTFAAEGKHTFTAVLMDEGVEVDSKPFTIIVAKCQGGLDIKFIHPLPGSVCTSPMSNTRKHPVTGESRPHKGCDFAYAGGKLGNVLASADGEVIFAGVQNGYGNIVAMGHTNAAGKRMCITKYAHLSSIKVSVGQKLSAGDVLGIEGNTGVGTGAHLHFEIRSGMGKGDQVLDPLAYISGKVKMTSATAKDVAGNPDPGGIASDAPITTQDNGVVGLPPAKVDQPCSGYKTEENPPAAGAPGGAPAATADDLKKPVPNTPGGCKPTPYTPPSVSEVMSRIRAVCDAAGDLDEEDKKFILFVAKIESRYDPYAKNPTSSATGLYQFLNALANKYFPMIGEAPTCENRCNIEKATKAMILFYKNEIRNYYNGWKSSGMAKIAGKSVRQTQHSARYPSLTKGCWCYGLIHHDGVGNAVSGTDKQGCEYYQRKLNAA